MAGPRTAAAGTSGIPDGGGVAHGPGRRPLVWGGTMHAPFPSKPLATAPDGKPRQTPVAFEPCGVFRPHAGKPGLAGFSHVGMAGLEPAASRPPAARAANCATFRNRRHPPPEPKPRWAKKEDGGVARRPGLEPGSTVLETAVLAIAPPTQREASTTPRAWPPGPPDDQASRTPPESPEPDSDRRPAAYEAAALPLGHRGLDGPSHRFFQCMMRVCSHGCLVGRATGGTVWWSRRDSDPRPSRCERDALPLRHGPMPAPTYARTGWKRSHSGGGVTPLVPSAGFEPATPTLGGWRSIP